MSATYDKDGTISTFKGDSFKIRINKIPKNANYTLYFSVYDKNNNIIFEIEEESNNEDYVIFDVKKEYTELCTVEAGKTKEIYYHALKYCLNDEEHTATVKDTKYGTRYKFIVNSKRVEGTVDE